jgi:hypothetical protein
MEPTVRTFPIERSTLRSTEDVQNWIARTTAALLDAIESGPVLIS